MSWPTPQDYNEAVQNPRLTFSDKDLQVGRVELNPLGLPRPICGRFASVYKIQNAGRVWAARCFLSEVPDQQQRYEAITQRLAKASLIPLLLIRYLRKEATGCPHSSSVLYLIDAGRVWAARCFLSEVPDQQ